MRGGVLVALALAAACGSRPAAETELPSPLAAAIAGALAGWREAPDPATGVAIPAAAAAVVLADGRVEAAASSAGDAGLGPQSTFRLASVTKLFTAAVVLQLAQEGRLSLDEPIARWVAYPGGDAITVAMLLSHTSGIPNLSDDLNDRDRTPRELVDSVAARGVADFPPGTSWGYSNTGYVLLGLIVEQAAGRSWQDEVRSRIVRPLGLASVHAHGSEPGPAPVPGWDLSCTTDDGGEGSETDCIGRPSRAVHVAHSYDWKFAWAAGALVASAPDAARFAHALVAGDLLDDAHRARMLTPVPVTVEYMREAYARSGARQLVLGVGLGPWLFDVEGVGRAWGHAGSIPGFNNSLLYYPERGFGAAVLNALLPAGTDTYVPGAAPIGRAVLALLPASG